MVPPFTAGIHIPPPTRIPRSYQKKNTYLWQVDIGNNDAVQRTWRIPRRVGRVSTGVVLVLEVALGVGRGRLLPRLAVRGGRDLGLRGSRGGVGAYKSPTLALLLFHFPSFPQFNSFGGRELTKVVTGTTDGSAGSGHQDLNKHQHQLLLIQLTPHSSSKANSPRVRPPTSSRGKREAPT